MCGIVGLFSASGPAPHRELWPTLVNHLRHRGPDEGSWWAEGPFFFGHRRLSIIGLETGGQPMATPDGRLVVTYNGEIYNYRELRAELEKAGYSFRTESDTEVLLHGYRAWGDGLPARLTGMFAFALADRDRGELFLARDRFGEKPLLYVRGPGYFAFSSELRPLTALPDLPRRLDLTALGTFLSLNYLAGSRTLMEGVLRLPPGHFMRSTGEPVRYWTPPAAVGPSLSLEAGLEEFQARFDRAVRLNLTSDVPVGILLSGGMDSALVAESAMRQGSLNCAYCLDFEDQRFSERSAAAEVCRRLDLPLETVTLTKGCLAQFPRLVEHADDPLGDSSCLAYHTVAELASRRNKVVLGGDGGDEMFGGYLTYRASLLHQSFVQPLPGPFKRALQKLAFSLPGGSSEGKVTFAYKLMRFLRAAPLPTSRAHLTWNGSFLPSFGARLVRPEVAPYVDGALDFARPGPVTLLDLQRSDLEHYLPSDILCKGDRMSMACGLEARAPFLEHELAGWGLALAPELKIRGSRLKRLLRAAAHRVYGSVIADRPKQGFSIPIHAWLRAPEGQVVRDYLTPSALEQVGVFEVPAVQEILRQHMACERSWGFELWGLAVVSCWHERRLRTVPPAPLDARLLERVL